MQEAEHHDEDSLDRLIHRLRAAQRPDPTLVLGVVTGACTRFPVLAKSGKGGRLDRLILDAAWTDAALTLVELELPMWTLRRLIRDADEWLCSLSRHPHMPIEFDETVDGRHEAMPIAILISLLEAKRVVAAAASRVATVPRVRARTVSQTCCDNFR